MNTERTRHWRHTYEAMQPEVEHTQKQKVKVVVKRRRWVSKGEKILYSLSSVGFVIACLYIVFFASTTDHVNRDIQSLEQSINEQQVYNESLYFEVKELSKPERIMRIAEERGLKLQESKVKQAQLIKE